MNSYTIPEITSDNLSLLYPESYSDAESVKIDPASLKDLGADNLLNSDAEDISRYYSSDPKVIRYRHEMFEDIIEKPDILDTFSSIIPIVNDISEIRKLEDDPILSEEAYLYSITEIELYSSVINTLNDTFKKCSDSLKSTALKRINDVIDTLANSEYYRNINSELEKLTSRVREIKSVTIGLNLDNTLKVESAGVLSVNNEKFKSGQLLDKIIRLNFKSDEMTCISPLIPFKKEQSDNMQLAMTLAMNNALTEVYKSSVKSWKNVIREYILEKTDFLIKLLPEISFVKNAVALINNLSKKNLPLSYPEISDDKSKFLRSSGIYNPIIALNTNDNIINNDFSFDETGMIHVLTGPNRGGKSVITAAVGIMYVMAGLGMPVCAEKCLMYPADKIFTHFPSGNDETINKGRLGEECERLSGILKKVTESSLLLMDESFSSTGAYEASEISEIVLKGISYIGCKAIFSTHLHELASRVPSINEKCREFNGSLIDTLVAQTEGNDRSFKILKMEPKGKSYASDIAEKYGISFDEITKNH